MIEVLARAPSKTTFIKFGSHSGVQPVDRVGAEAHVNEKRGTLKRRAGRFLGRLE